MRETKQQGRNQIREKIAKMRGPFEKKIESIILTIFLVSRYVPKN